MHISKILAVSAFAVFALQPATAQIFINTGNPHLDKYKEENPGAIIWDANKETMPVDKTAPAAETTPVREAVNSIPRATPKATAESTAIPPRPTATPGGPPDYPENAEPGKCYARCYVSDVYEFKEEEVVDKPAHEKVEKIPARYETVYDTIIVKPATVKTVTVAAQYENVEEKILVTPAGKKWVKGKADKNCLSANPADCEVWCVYEIPAEYKTVTRKVEKVPAYTRQEEVPAVTKVVPRQKMVEPARENRIQVAATYKTVMKKVLVRKGGYNEWKEVLCEAYVTNTKISDIQSALVREGYDPGPADNQMGPKTKEALVKYQQDKGLPVGNLNIETLKALGVEK